MDMEKYSSAIKMLKKASKEAQEAVNEEFRKKKYPLKEIDFMETWDWAFSCPNCTALTDQKMCPKCQISMNGENLLFLRLKWLEPPEPTVAYDDLISAEEKEIYDIEFKKAEQILSRMYASSKNRGMPSQVELRRALEYCMWANKQDGHYATAIIAAGVCYYLLEEYFEAILCWVHEAEEDDIDSLYYLFKAYRKVGWYRHAAGVARMISSYCSPTMNIVAKKLEEIPRPSMDKELIDSVDSAIEEKLRDCLRECLGAEDIMYRPANEFFD